MKNEYYTEYPACGGRSVHKLSWQVTEKFEIARDSLRKFVGAEQSSEIVFTKNATEGMNIVANGLKLKEGDQVLTTDKEHNANVVPWHHLSKYNGIKYDVLPSKDNYYLGDAGNTEGTNLCTSSATSGKDIVLTTITTDTFTITFGSNHANITNLISGQIITISGSSTYSFQFGNLKRLFFFNRINLVK